MSSGGPPQSMYAMRSPAESVAIAAATVSSQQARVNGEISPIRTPSSSTMATDAINIIIAIEDAVPGFGVIAVPHAYGDAFRGSENRQGVADGGGDGEGPQRRLAQAELGNFMNQQQICHARIREREKKKDKTGVKDKEDKGWWRTWKIQNRTYGQQSQNE
nr:hypothetical protein Iba_chr03bCG12470 [Ipomoea batatas]